MTIRTISPTPVCPGRCPAPSTKVKAAAVDIRGEEHRATAEATERQAAGYSPRSFGLDGDGQAVTATEVDRRDRRSMVTRRKKAGYWRHDVADMTHELGLLARARAVPTEILNPTWDDTAVKAEVAGAILAETGAAAPGRGHVSRLDETRSVGPATGLDAPELLKRISR